MHNLHCVCGKLLAEAEGEATILRICPKCKRKMRFEVAGGEVKATEIPRNQPAEYK